ncbi:MAG TPA: A/G-specific adenine glycosylase, partial [Myxococcota bacterium]|nr:A/G-specific adenine glycosylase [Myxococcota bacterium]
MDTDALISWYQQSRRTMPWREEVSPYRTLVSELMLQQTRVETVIPYFERFMRSFPTEQALAEAPLERVLEHWSGLGYYSRARNLHAAARKVVELGGFPQTVAGLLELPGVGPYTAGAIASIALGLDAPLVDGNVERVLCRHDARAEDPVKIKKELWERATFLLPKGQASDFNQALMELGATVCTPSSPRCLFCPIRSTCHGHDAPERYPQKAPRAAVPEATACALERNAVASAATGCTDSACRIAIAAITALTPCRGSASSSFAAAPAPAPVVVREQTTSERIAGFFAGAVG